MKFILLSFSVGAVYFLSNISVNHVTNGQSSSDPNRTFHYIRFDEVNRGGFNMSTCITELLNCWELLRGDMICSFNKYYETVCGLQKNDCHDYYGKQESSWYKFTMFEAYCKSDGWQEWTK